MCSYTLCILWSCEKRLNDAKKTQQEKTVLMKMIEQRLAHWANEHTHARTHTSTFSSQWKVRWDSMGKCAYWIYQNEHVFSLFFTAWMLGECFFHCTHTLTYTWHMLRAKVAQRKRDMEKHVDTTKSSCGSIFMLRHQRLSTASKKFC